MCLPSHEETTEGRPMTVQDIAQLGKMLGRFLKLFANCFTRPAGRALLEVDVRGLLSDAQRKNAEVMALDQNVAPRTLQRFLESIVWDEQKLRDRCQQLVAREQADGAAIGCVDETGTAKSGSETVGVKRQYNRNRGKIENCINNVAFGRWPVEDCLAKPRKNWASITSNVAAGKASIAICSAPAPANNSRPAMMSSAASC